MLTDRGSEFCGNSERHEYELYLAVENIDHSHTKTKSPQTNGICERFHKTVLNEFLSGCVPQRSILFNRRAAGRSGRVDQGLQRGTTTSGTFLDAMPMTKEKMIAA